MCRETSASLSSTEWTSPATSWVRVHPQAGQPEQEDLLRAGFSDPPHSCEDGGDHHGGGVEVRSGDAGSEAVHGVDRCSHPEGVQQDLSSGEHADPQGEDDQVAQGRYGEADGAARRCREEGGRGREGGGDRGSHGWIGRPSVSKVIEHTTIS